MPSAAAAIAINVLFNAGAISVLLRVVFGTARIGDWIHRRLPDLSRGAAEHFALT
jgi:hypothetical protein